MATKNLYKLLGPREQELMEYFWEHGRTSSLEVHQAMKRPSTTVNTTLQRLAEKGLLFQEKSKCKAHGYFYTPRLSKEELMLEALEILLSDFKASPGERKRLAQAIKG